MAGGTTAKMASPEIVEKLMTAQKMMPTDAEKAFDILLPALMPRGIHRRSIPRSSR